MALINLQLQAGRPLLEVILAASGPQMRSLLDAGKALPPPQTISGLIDTGASLTCIDLPLVAKLGLAVEGRTEITSSTTGVFSVRSYTYKIGLILLSGNDERLFLPDLRVVALDLSRQQDKVLIGRDVLSRCLLVYDGKHQSMTLAY